MLEQGHQGPQGMNGVTLADRAVRHLGIEVANTQIALASMNARMEELAEIATHIDFSQWDEIQPPKQPSPEDEAHEGYQQLPQEFIASIERKYIVPVYQADTVMRLLTLLQGR